MRTLGFYDKTINDIKSLDSESYEALEYYVKGVNEYIDSKPTLPLEMQLLLRLIIIRLKKELRKKAKKLPMQ